MEVIGAVGENSATTRTGELTVAAPGETMLTVCAKTMVDEDKSASVVKMRALTDTLESSSYFARWRRCTIWPDLSLVHGEEQLALRAL